MTTLAEISLFLSKEIMNAMYMTPEELDPDALFSSYGLESTTLTKIVAKVNQEFGTSLVATDILPFQSVNRAAKAIYESMEGVSL